MWKLEEYKPSAAHVAAFQSVSREKLQEICNAISSWPEHRMAECDKARAVATA